MLFTKKYRVGFRERLTFYSEEKKSQLRQGPYIWVHTVSVGELQAARPLLQRLRREFPQYKILVSTVTETGQNLARSLPEIDTAVYFPLDLPKFCRRALRLVNPACIIIFETELWPNFILAAAEKSLPLLLVNARLSDRSFRRYLFLHRLFSPVLACFSAILTQSEVDAERFRQLGASPEKTHCVGNIKFDAATPSADPQERSRWRNRFQIQEEDIVLLGGSTFPGEEIILCRITETLRKSGLSVRLILAPRHIERVPAILKELESGGRTIYLRSQITEISKFPDPFPIMLLDTIGELRNVYAAADIVFMGKSLTASGGQNPLEPAAWGKPILFGPQVGNFRDITAQLLQAQGAWMIHSEAELQSACETLCRDPQRRKNLGNQAQRVLQQNQGALNRILEKINRMDWAASA